ncbi:MAG: flagellar hook protein FlgE [Acidimicrobiales bacterium]
MDRALLAAVSGIDANQTYLDDIGNNIANINTNGYKEQNVDFVDLLAQQVSGAAAPPVATNVGAGIDPMAIGSGVRIGAVSSQLSEGSLQQTNQPTDVAINGSGFLVSVQNGQQLYTRSGHLTLDGSGNLATPTGGLIQGWQAVNGVINNNAPTGGISIPTGQVVPANPTTQFTVGGNLPAWAGGSTAGTAVTTTVNAFDSLGNAVPVTLTFTPVTGTAGEWTIQGSVPGATGKLWSTPPDIQFDPTSGQIKSITGVTANADGSFTLPVGTMPSNYTFPTSDTWAFKFPPPGTAAAFTQFASQSSPPLVTQDGNAAGTLSSFSIGSDGVISGSFSNGQTEKIAQVALANFSNPGGLASVGSLNFTSSANSGTAVIGVPGAGGRGTLIGGSLESSNVDLAGQLTNLVVAQEAYQANTKVVNTAAAVNQSLVQMA